MNADPVRFKFMPTPSGPLHVGHAWLVFVMHSLVKAARREGRDAELVLVIDRLNVKHNVSCDDVAAEQNSRQIIIDLHRLGMAPDCIVYNDDTPFADRVDGETIAACSLKTWRSSCPRPASYYLLNAVLDARLGITHIVRGEDRREFNDVYEECYGKIHYPQPWLVYIPMLLRENDGAKVSAHKPYLVSTVLEKSRPEELFCTLVNQCIKPGGAEGPYYEPARDRRSAEKKLCGGNWREMIRGEPAATERFLARFARKPRVTIKAGRCVAPS